MALIATYGGKLVGRGVRGSIAKQTTYQVLPGKCKHGAGDGEPYQIQYAYKVPYNPRTETQQAWRAIFAAGTAAWAALSPAEKQEWNDKALEEIRQARTRGELYKVYYGWHLFMSDYLKTH